MRNTEQQKKFDSLVSRIEQNEGLVDTLIKTQLRLKQYKLLSQFEGLVEFKGKYTPDPDTYENLEYDYYSTFYQNILYLIYYEAKEDYEICSIIQEIICLFRSIFFDTIDCIDKQLTKDDYREIVGLAEDEIKTLIYDLYGRNH